MNARRRICSAIAAAAIGAGACVSMSFGSVAYADDAQTLLCGSTNGLATYNGTNAERDLHKAIPDPLKVANYPCNFPPSVRGIRIDRGSVSLVQGGKLLKTIPLPATLGVVTLPEIVQAVDNPAWIAETSPGVILLTSSLVQEKGTDLVVAAPAVTMVRIVFDAGDSIVGSGCTANFDGVTVESWDSKTDAVVPTSVDGRPFVLYENDATFNISNSNFSYLGSDETSSYGVSWRVAGTNGTVDHSVFEHNFFGVYTFQAKNVVFENSTFAYNTFYGIDPHTSSSHLTITGNDVFGNLDHGIVFSQYVTDSVVSDNNVHDNKVNGIMMDFHSDNNTITNNTVTHNGEGIVMSGSAGNNVFGNTVTDNPVGFRASHAGADGDNVHDNVITGGVMGVQLYGGATTTMLTNNTIKGASKYGVVVDAARTVLVNNQISGTPTGIKLETVASVTGGEVSASKTGIEADSEAFASVNNVQVDSPAQVRASRQGFVSLVGTTFTSLTTAGTVSTLDLIGVSILAFALVCEIIHLTRVRQLRQVSLAFAGPAGFLDERPTVSRFVVRQALPSGARTIDLRTPEPPPAEPALRRFRPDIEGLRAIAVIAVVLSHASLGVPGGYVGVDVFFVISGFLITRQLFDEGNRRGTISFSKFYARRARRILPAATIVTVATLIASYFWAGPLRVAGIARDGIAAALFGVNWRMASTGTNYFSASAPPSPFQHYWSLSVEEQFYLAWPLLLAAVLFVFRKKATRTKALVTVLAILIGTSLWASVYVTQRSAPYGYFGTHTRVWELATGALLAVTADHLRRLPRRIAAITGWLGLGAIMLACIIFNASTLYPGSAAVLPVAGAALIIAAGCGAAARYGPEKLLKVWPMRWGGRISYSLYLWHWPLLILLPDALGHPLTVVQRLLAIAIAVALSGLTYSLVEQPFQRRQVFVAKPSRALALAAGLIAISVATALVIPSLVNLPGKNQPTTTPVLLAAMQAPLANATAGSGVDAQLAAALTAAAAVKQLPANVTPPLTKAAADFPNTQGCEAVPTASAPKLPCNQFGDPNGTKQVVLIGDSHAGMWLSGINSVAVANHWRLTVYTKSDCPVGYYPDLVNPTLKRVYTECNTWRSTIIARIVAMKPALVIIGSLTRAIAAAEPNGLEISIKQIQASGARVAFIADTPSPAKVGTIADCLAAHVTGIEDCDVPRDEAGLDSPGRVAEVQAAQRAGATVIDPAPWFCTATVCPAVIQNVIAYSDGTHISGTYGLLRAPQLGAALTAALS
jgi:parallel beta-helix repeat protein